MKTCKTLGTDKCVQIISECIFLVQGKNIFVESCMVGCIHAKIIFSLSHQPNSFQTSESNHVSHSAVALISAYSQYNHTRIDIEKSGRKMAKVEIESGVKREH